MTERVYILGGYQTDFSQNWARNGVEIFDGKQYVEMPKGPGQVLDRFNPSSGLKSATA